MLYFDILSVNMKAVLSCVSLLFCYSHVVSQKRCAVDFIRNHLLRTLPNDLETELKLNCEACMLEQDLTWDLLKTVELATPIDPPKNVKCYFKCYFTKCGSMDAKGTLIPQPHALTPDAFKILTNCVIEAYKYKDHCDRAYHGYACYLKFNNQ